MLIKKGNRFELYPHKVRYNQHGKEHEQWALPNKEWWVDFADKWEHTEIIEFAEVELTEEQLSRFEQVKIGIPEAFTTACEDYILEGKFPEGISHPLIKLQLANKDKLQDEYIDGVAETAVCTAMDANDLAETLVYALNKINELEAKIDG